MKFVCKRKYLLALSAVAAIGVLSARSLLGCAMFDRGKTGTPEHKETVLINDEQEQKAIISRGSSRSVPVIPNESIITGKVVSYYVTSSATLNIKPNQMTRVASMQWNRCWSSGLLN